MRRDFRMQYQGGTQSTCICTSTPLERHEMWVPSFTWTHMKAPIPPLAPGHALNEGRGDLRRAEQSVHTAPSCRGTILSHSLPPQNVLAWQVKETSLNLSSLPTALARHHSWEHVACDLEGVTMSQARANVHATCQQEFPGNTHAFSLFPFPGDSQSCLTKGQELSHLPKRNGHKKNQP